LQFNIITEVTQLKNLEPSDVARLLRTLFATHLTDHDVIDITDNIAEPSLFSDNWLEHLWHYLQKYFEQDLCQFEGLHLIPVAEGRLAKLSKNIPLILSCDKQGELSSVIQDIGKQLGLIIIETLLPSVQGHACVLDNYILRPDAPGFVESLLRISSTDSIKKSILKDLSCDKKRSLKEFLMDGLHPKSGIFERVKHLLKVMPIFETVADSGFEKSQLVCLEDLDLAAPKDKVPFKVPEVLIDVTDINVHQFALKLGIRQRTISEVLKKMVLLIISTDAKNTQPNDHRVKKKMKGQYSSEDVVNIMTYVLNNLKLLVSNDTNMYDDISLLSLFGQVAFVLDEEASMKAPNELFDCHDAELTILLAGLDVFPCGTFADIQYREGLLLLGLKSLHSITHQDVLRIAQVLNMRQNIGVSTVTQAQSLLRSLERVLPIDESLSDKDSLATKLLNFKCISALQSRPNHYPNSLTFPDETHLYLPNDVCTSRDVYLVGSVKPTLDTKDCQITAEIMGWTRRPALSDVIIHLTNVVKCYNAHEKLDYQYCLFKIYQYMNNNIDGLADMDDVNTTSKLNILHEIDWIWHGCGFTSVKKIVKKHSNIHLEPYVYELPKELVHLTSLWNFLKIPERFDTLSVLEAIHANHSHVNDSSWESVEQTLKIAVDVLDHLASAGIDDYGIRDKLLIPIKTPDNRLQLEPIVNCTYCEEESTFEIESDDKTFFIVHHLITRRTADSLHIHNSVSRQLDADELEFGEEFGQNEPLTTRIHNLLREYTDGLMVLKELIQNADDAGATEIKFLYDQRTNEDAKSKLIDKKMADLQGPAMWVYNNAVFTDQDVVNVVKLGGATKEDNVSKIGRFGVGFNAVYNLTDVPSFASRNFMVIFDPHTTYLGRAIRNRSKPGLKLDLAKNNKLLAKFSDQFKPFKDIFNYKVDDLEIEKTNYHGTLFRFPLRTHTQAQSSEISKKHYSHAEMISLLKLLKNAGQHLLLFTQHVRKIEVFHIEETCTPWDIEQLFTIDKCLVKVVRSIDTKNEWGILQHYTNLRKHFSTTNNTVEKYVTSTVIEILVNVTSSDFGELEMISTNCHWLVLGCIGKKRSLEIALEENNLIPVGGVAVRLVKQGTDDGSLFFEPVRNFGSEKNPTDINWLFCFLPLPIQSQLPININGYFSVTPSRRHLHTRDNEDKESSEADWNEALFQDAIASAYRMSLEDLIQICPMPTEPYCVWPQVDSIQGINVHSNLIESLYIQLYESVHVKVVQVDSKFLSLCECHVLNSELREIEIVGDIAMEVIRTVKSTDFHILDLPTKIIKTILMTAAGIRLEEQTISTSEFYSKWFLPNINKIDAESRDFLLIHLLFDDNYYHLISEFQCIPVCKMKHLMKPCNLIHPDSKVAVLYDVDDGKFPKFAPSSHKSHIITDVYYRLVKLGMKHDRLNWEEISERCHFVTKYDDLVDRRLSTIVSIMSSELEVTGDSQLDTVYIDCIKNTKFLPLLKKPNNYPVKWYGDEYLGKYTSCNDGYTCEKHNLVSCSYPIIDSQRAFKCENEALLLHLGLTKKPIYERTVLEQFSKVIEIADATGEIHIAYTQGTSLRKIVHEVYKFFDQNVSADAVEFLKKNKSILIAGKFHLLLPTQCCVTMPRASNSLVPYLACITTSLSNCKSLLPLIGIKESFDLSDYVHVLQEIQRQASGEALTEANLDIALKIINNFLYHSEEVYYESICNETIYLPNTKSVLCTSDSLCFNNCLWITVDDENCCHGLIPYPAANFLKVKKIRQDILEKHSKRLRFGQKEKLTNRIKQILTEYGLGVEILNEMLQNADDAGATVLHFIKDYRNLEKKRIFDECWEPLQGPALCIYNNKPFSELDLEGIQNLGEGSKGKNPDKIGQFGVGFNCVFNLTDVPSILTTVIDGNKTNRVLCAFDPSCKFVPDTSEDEPGRRFDDIEILKKKFPDVFLGYLEDQYGNSGGTLFRLPLRNEKTAADSKISSKKIELAEVDALFVRFKEAMYESLLFLSNVEEIELKETTSSGGLNVLYKIKLVLLPEARDIRNQFQHKIKQATRLIKNGTFSLRDIPLYEVSYELHTEDSDGNYDKWHIVNRLGFEDPSCISEILDKAYADEEIFHLPLAGCAYLLETKRLPHVSKLFCFLPLPIELTNSMPVNINGHFALSHENRKSLAIDKRRTSQVEWNSCLITNVIAPAYCNLILVLCDNFFPPNTLCSIEDKRHDSILATILSDYYELFPKRQTQRMTKSETNEEHIEMLVCAVFKHIAKANLPLLAVSDYPSGSKTIGIRWIGPLKNEQGHFEQGHFECDDTEINRILINCGFPMFIWCPRSIYDSFKFVGCDCVLSTAEHAINFFSTYEHQNTRCRIPALPAPIDKTPLKSNEDLFRILRFCKNCKYRLHNLPLLLGINNNLMTFSANHLQLVCVPTFYNIFPDYLNSVMHPNVVSILELDPTQDTKLCRRLEIKDLGQKLPSVFPPEEYQLSAGCKYLTLSNLQCTLNTVLKNTDAGQWLVGLWDFIDSRTKDFSESSRSAALDCLKSWSLLPVAQQSAFNTILIPLQKSSSVVRTNDCADWYFDKHSEWNKKKGRYILRVPQLTKLPNEVDTALNNLRVSRPIRKFFSLNIYESIILKTDLDKSVLLGLQEIAKSEGKTITTSEWSSLRVYLGNMYSMLDFEAMEAVKRLDIFKNVFGKQVALHGFCAANVLPVDILTDELDLIAKPGEFIFLSETDGTVPLLTKLSFKFKRFTIVDFYVEFVLLHFELLSSSAKIKHMTKVRDIFSMLHDKKKHGTFYDEMEFDKLMNCLKNLAFIPDKQGMLTRASEFYDHKNKVFVAMGVPLPSKEYLSEYWWEFLKECGMICELTQDMFVSFSNRVATQAVLNRNQNQKHSKHLHEQSRVLVHWMKHVLDEYSDMFWQQIKDIRFVAPHQVEDTLEKLLTQYGDKNDIKELSFISFNRSVISSDNDELIWAVQRLAPSSFVREEKDFDRKEFFSKVQLDEYPKPDLIAINLFNLCTHLVNKQLVNYPTSLTHVLNKILTHLKLNIDSFSSETRDVLKRAPCILVDHDSNLVLPNQIVFTLIEDIKPYLYSFPLQLGQFADLMKILGSTDTATMEQYATVLYMIHDKQIKTVLTAGDIDAIKRSMRGLFSIIQSSPGMVAIDLDLFLPNEDMKLYPSQDLIAINKPSFKHRIVQLNRPIFIDLNKCGMAISPQETEKLMLRLPIGHQPNLITAVVRENIRPGYECIELPIARIVQDKIRSNQFRHAIASLGWDVLQKSSNPGSHEKIEEKIITIMKGLKNIQIVGVNKVTTYLEHRGIQYHFACLVSL